MFDRRNFILGGVAMAGCANNFPKNEISDDEYEIFNAVVRDIPCRYGQTTELIENVTFAVDPGSRSWDNINPVMTYWTKPKTGTEVRIPEDAISDFYAVNRRSHAIQTDRIRGACNVFITPAEAEKIRPTLDMGAYVSALRERRSEAAQQFLKREEGEAAEDPAPATELEPPRTIHSLSRFGFNAARDTAVGGRRYRCGPECFAELLVIARKEPQGWRVTDELVMLIG